jgi:molybdate transport system substrate-binding protein
VERRAYLALLSLRKGACRIGDGWDMRTLLLAAGICFLAMSGLTGAASAGDIKVFSDGPLRAVLTAIAERFQRETEHRVQLSFDTAPALKARLASGETGDILIVAAADAEELTKQGKLSAEGQAVVAHVSIGLAIREGVPVPDIGTLDALKETLLRAETLVFTNLLSGTQFLKAAERLGIAEDVKSKSTQFPSGAEVFGELLKRNGRDIGIGSVMQIVEYGPKGLRLVGPLPAEILSPTALIAGVMTGAKSPAVAAEFIHYLRSPESRASLVTAGAN